MPSPSILRSDVRRDAVFLGIQWIESQQRIARRSCAMSNIDPNALAAMQDRLFYNLSQI